MSVTGIILQARMGSSRLPGKVLKLLSGASMIERIICRLKQSRRSDMVVLATTNLASDDGLAQLGSKLGVRVFRGSELDVLDRYLKCAQQFNFDNIVRATGDNPFVDIEELDRLIEFQNDNNLDYASAFPEFGSGLPVGIGVEIFTMEALDHSWREGTEPHHREHVNEYIQENPDLFRQRTLISPSNKVSPDLNFTVDTPEQFAAADRLIQSIIRENGTEGTISTEQLISLGKPADGEV